MQALLQVYQSCRSKKLLLLFLTVEKKVFLKRRLREGQKEKEITTWPNIKKESQTSYTHSNFPAFILYPPFLGTHTFVLQFSPCRQMFQGSTWRYAGRETSSYGLLCLVIRAGKFLRSAQCLEGYRHPLLDSSKHLHICLKLDVKYLINHLKTLNTCWVIGYKGCNLTEW